MRLLLELPIDLGNMVRVEDTGAIVQRMALRKQMRDEFGIDGAVDLDMCNLQALRP